MTYSTKKIKKHIYKFDFYNSEWENFPSKIFEYNLEGLSKEEKHLIKAMKFAYFANESGRDLIYKKLKTAGLITIITVFIIFFGLIGLLSLDSQEKFTKPVNAATVSAQIKQRAEEVMESTRSALIKR